jgi:ATP-dependent DNA helicase DinG
MSLVSSVEAAFAPSGLISRAEPHFVPRGGQTAMAVAVAQAIEGVYPLVVEASTGVGKTFSYLVPALLSGERVLVSTATKALQDQLFGKDLPKLISALGLPIRAAILKGRASYLCLHRLESSRQEIELMNRALRPGLAQIERWSHSTNTGDLAELGGLDERSPLIPLVTSTRENCLGSSCPSFKTCYVNLARREALAADVVVINHHLFFADLSIRESGMAELLPSVRIAVFDEAHQLNEIGVQFLGSVLTTGQLVDFSHDLLASGHTSARGLIDWPELAAQIEHAARDLRMCAGGSLSGARLRWGAKAPEGIIVNDWLGVLSRVEYAVLRCIEALEKITELGPDLVRLVERAKVLAQRTALFQGDSQTGYVRWAEVGKQLRLIESPLDVAQAMQTKVLGTAEGLSKTWIFTSATLGDDSELSWFTSRCGLQHARVMRIGSPFDYQRQAAVYIPAGFPKPNDPAHAFLVATFVAEWARRLGGRTMLLTTTLKALGVIGSALAESFQHSDDIEVLVQGSMPKRLLVERFREGADVSGKGFVLVASASFWEGIDFPGNMLQLVVIDKLPFPPPADPLVEARAKALELDGKSAFNEYFLPEAAVALKQGAGRLIRRETDQGVLVVCDSRLASMGYGQRLLKALPPMKRLRSEDELLVRLDQLTKTCTKDSL